MPLPDKISFTIEEVSPNYKKIILDNLSYKNDEDWSNLVQTISATQNIIEAEATVDHKVSQKDFDALIQVLREAKVSKLQIQFIKFDAKIDPDWIVTPKQINDFTSLITWIKEDQSLQTVILRSDIFYKERYKSSFPILAGGFIWFTKNTLESLEKAVQGNPHVAVLVIRSNYELSRFETILENLKFDEKRICKSLISLYKARKQIIDYLEEGENIFKVIEDGKITPTSSITRQASKWFDDVFSGKNTIEQANSKLLTLAFKILNALVEVYLRLCRYDLAYNIYENPAIKKILPPIAINILRAEIILQDQGFSIDDDSEINKMEKARFILSLIITHKIDSSHDVLKNLEDNRKALVNAYYTNFFDKADIAIDCSMLRDIANQALRDLPDEDESKKMTSSWWTHDEEWFKKLSAHPLVTSALEKTLGTSRVIPLEEVLFPTSLSLSKPQNSQFFSEQNRSSEFQQLLQELLPELLPENREIKLEINLNYRKLKYHVFNLKKYLFLLGYYSFETAKYLNDPTLLIAGNYQLRGLIKAAEQGWPVALSILALYQEEVNKDNSLANEYRKESAFYEGYYAGHLGNNDISYHLGQLYSSEFIKGLEKSAEELQRAELFFLLGNIYFYGNSSTEKKHDKLINKEKALIYYKKGSDLNHKESLVQLVLLYIENEKFNEASQAIVSSGFGIDVFITFPNLDLVQKEKFYYQLYEKTDNIKYLYEAARCGNEVIIQELIEKAKDDSSMVLKLGDLFALGFFDQNLLHFEMACSFYLRALISEDVEVVGKAVSALDKAISEKKLPKHFYSWYAFFHEFDHSKIAVDKNKAAFIYFQELKNCHGATAEKTKFLEQLIPEIGDQKLLFEIFLYYKTLMNSAVSKSKEIVNQCSKKISELDSKSPLNILKEEIISTRNSFLAPENLSLQCILNFFSKSNGFSRFMSKYSTSGSDLVLALQKKIQHCKNKDNLEPQQILDLLLNKEILGYASRNSTIAKKLAVVFIQLEKAIHQENEISQLAPNPGIQCSPALL